MRGTAVLSLFSATLLAFLYTIVAFAQTPTQPGTPNSKASPFGGPPSGQPGGQPPQPGQPGGPKPPAPLTATQQGQLAQMLEVYPSFIAYATVTAAGTVRSEFGNAFSKNVVSIYRAGVGNYFITTKSSRLGMVCLAGSAVINGAYCSAVLGTVTPNNSTWLVHCYPAGGANSRPIDTDFTFICLGP
jgi:hypothetical protein